MNGNLFAAYSYGCTQQSTPPRKPSIHHCNAERKNNPYRCLNQDDLQPITRNLFGEPSGSISFGLPFSTKSLR